MPKSRFKLVVFDFDGTLFDCLPHKIKLSLKLISEKTGLTPKEAEKIYYLNDFRVSHIIAGHLGLSEEERREVAKEYLRRKARALTNAKLFAEVETALRKMREAGLKLALVSLAHEGDAQKQLNKIKGFFDEVAFSDPLKKVYVKTPEFLSDVSERLNVAPGEAVFVGDAQQDIEIGKKAGFFTVAREGTLSRKKLEAAGADLIVKDLNELVEFLLK